MQDDCKNFLSDLVAYRSTHHLSQQQMAVFMGVSRRTIAGWEAGEASPPENRLHKYWEMLRSGVQQNANDGGEDWKARAIAAETKLAAIRSLLGDERTNERNTANASSGQVAAQADKIQSEAADKVRRLGSASLATQVHRQEAHTGQPKSQQHRGQH